MIPIGAEVPCAGSDHHISDNERDWTEAKRICRPCPFKAECLKLALAYEFPSQKHSNRAGVWGGYSPVDRAKLHGAAA